MTSRTENKTASNIPESNVQTRSWVTPHFRKLATSSAEAATGPNFDNAELLS